MSVKENHLVHFGSEVKDDKNLYSDEFIQKLVK
jgi:hypothetical protein